MATATGLREPVEFTPNVPVEVALAYQTGKIVKGVNGDRVMFSLVDGRVMFLDLGPAEKINSLGIKAREPFFLCKHWSGKKTERAEWNAWLAPEAEKRRAQTDARAAGDGSTVERLQRSIDRAEEIKVGVQRDGTFVVPGAGVAAPAPVGVTASTSAPNSGHGNGSTHGNGAGGSSGAPKHPDPSIFQGWSQFLLAETNALVDVYAAALSYASQKYGNQVKPEDVRSLLVTAFIQRAKGGSIA
jgi:hypothetical protein